MEEEPILRKLGKAMAKELRRQIKYG